jgi:hypothetical protein
MLLDSDFCCTHFGIFSRDASFQASISHIATNAQLLGVQCGPVLGDIILLCFIKQMIILFLE